MECAVFNSLSKPASETHYWIGRQGTGAFFGKDPERERDNHNLFCLISPAGSTNHEVSSISYADGGEKWPKWQKARKNMGYHDNTETMLFKGNLKITLHSPFRIELCFSLPLSQLDRELSITLIMQNNNINGKTLIIFSIYWIPILCQIYS